MLSAAGRILVLLGSVLLLFVAYQLWGTGLLQARSQSGLASDFAQRLEAVGVTDDLLAPWETEGGRPGESPSPAEPSSLAEPSSTESAATAEVDSVPNSAAEASAVSGGASAAPDGQALGTEASAVSGGASAGRSNLPDTLDEPIPVTSLSERAAFRSTVEYMSPEVEDQLEILYPPDGQALARIIIPTIGVDEMVVAGVEVGDLRRGPGHYSFTPLPGQPGNAGIAGHRTTYGAPFARIDELKVDDLIYVRTLQGLFKYQVIPPVASEVLEFEVGHQIVLPHEVGVLDDYSDNRLTLTSCHPRYSSSRRIIVQAVLLGDPVVRLPRPGAELEMKPPRALADEPLPPSPAETAETDSTADEVSPPRDERSADLSGGERNSEAGSGAGAGSDAESGAGSDASDAAASAGSDDDASAAAAGSAASDASGSAGIRSSASSASSAASAVTSAVPAGGSSGESTLARAAAPRISDGFGTGLDGDPRAVAPAVIWGLAAAAVWTAGSIWSRHWRRLAPPQEARPETRTAGSIWSRHWRRLATWSITVVLFLLVLFAAFTHVDRALPSF